MKKMSLLTSFILFSIFTWNCSSNDDNGNAPNNSAGPSFIKLQLDGATVFDKSTNNPNPSAEFLNATISTQEFTLNGTTIPANTLSIVTGNDTYTQTGLGKMIMVLAYNITEVGTYNFTANANNQFFYSDTTNPSSTFISQIMEPFETTATITITKIGGLNPAGNGRYVSGYITGTAMSGSVSNPNEEMSFRLDFNGGVPE